MEISKSFDPSPILVFDSYYTDNTSVDILLEEEVPFIGSVRLDRFKELEKLVKLSSNEVVKPGQGISYLNSDNNLLFLYQWDVNQDIGKKFVISNGYVKKTKRRNDPKSLPLYNDYRNHFYYCDRFNRKLHDSCFCHRCGGGNRRGEFGQVHKFCLGILMQNIIAAYKYFRMVPKKEDFFQNYCFLLGKELVGATEGLEN